MRQSKRTRNKPRDLRKDARRRRVAEKTQTNRIVCEKIGQYSFERVSEWVRTGALTSPLWEGLRRACCIPSLSLTQYCSSPSTLAPQMIPRRPALAWQLPLLPLPRPQRLPDSPLRANIRSSPPPLPASLDDRWDQGAVR